MKQENMTFQSDGKMWRRGQLLASGGTHYLASLLSKRRNDQPFASLIAVKSAEISASGTLQKEVRILSDLQQCPQILGCYGGEVTYEEYGLTIYNALLECASGGTLLDMIINSSGRGLPESDVRRYTKTILLGLRHIHQHEYAHRNINPHSIQLVTSSSCLSKPDKNSSLDVKIAEFGCAKKLTADTGRTYRGDKWAGNPLYLSPESVNQCKQEAPADIWALGCTVVEMVTGRPAWNCCETESDILDLTDKIGSVGESPKIPDNISKEGKDFLKMCFLRYSNYRWTADMLLHHPFVAHI